MAPFPDVTHARDVVERLMVDECVITRDPKGHDDDIFDTGTGKYFRPVDDDDIIYDSTTTGFEGRSLNGKCKFSPQQNRSDLPREEGGRPEITRTYDGSLPWDAPEIKPGDLFTIVASARDPNAVNKTMVVLNETITTILVQRRITLEAVTDAFAGVRGS